MGNTKIEWTNKTWNPTVGCTKQGPGCANCYAMSSAQSVVRRMRKTADSPRAKATLDAYESALKMDGDGNPRAAWSGEVGLMPHRLDDPKGWRKPSRVFVDAMGDLLHPNVPTRFVDRVVETMEVASWHRYQLLTKFPARLYELDVRSRMMWRGFSNLDVGVSVESQAQVHRVSTLLNARVTVTPWVSFEPLIGPVELPDMVWSQLRWVVVGGESGRGDVRPCHPEWVRHIRDKCAQFNIPFFFKQWGVYAPIDGDNWSLPSGADDVVELEHALWMDAEGHTTHQGAATHLHTPFAQVGKKAAGNVLDGRQHLAEAE